MYVTLCMQKVFYANKYMHAIINVMLYYKNF